MEVGVNVKEKLMMVLLKNDASLYIEPASMFMKAGGWYRGMWRNYITVHKPLKSYKIQYNHHCL